MPTRPREITVTNRLGTRTLITELTLGEAAHVLGNATNQFARDLVVDYKRRPSLSDGKAKWLLYLAQEQLNRAARPVPAPERLTDDFTALAELFQTAVKKSPRSRLKIVLRTGRDRQVVLVLAGEGSRFPGSISVTDGGRYGESLWFGRVNTDGSFSPGRAADEDVRDLLVRFAADPAGVAAAYGKLTGSCCFCRIELTDERSVLVGYGPICAANYGLPWGDRPAKSKAVDRDLLAERQQDAQFARAERLQEERGFLSDPDFQEFSLSRLFDQASEIAARDGYPVPDLVGAVQGDDRVWRDDD